MGTNVASQSFDTLADLKLQTGVANVQVLLLGLSAMTDGNGGMYRWDSVSVETDDGFTIVQVTGVTTGRWKRVGNSNTVKGSNTLSGLVLQTAYVINHGLPFTPLQVYIQARSSNAAVPSWVSAITSTSFTVNFSSVPILGTNNLTIDWLVIKQ